ncbi:plastocyanin/azurin family copper-binding protein [Haladaptatus sp. NG-SE-30]
MSHESTTRRRFLTGGVAFTVASLAGCIGASPKASNDETSSPSSTTTTTNGDDHHHGGSTQQTESGHHENGSGNDDSHGSHGSELSGPKKDATVSMKTTNDGTHFEPHVVWVEPGATVTWSLESGAHSTTAYHPDNDRPQRVPNDASSWDSGTISESGGTFEQTFDTEGVYDYFCTPHESTGMVGSIIVGKPDHEGQPALRSPQESLPKMTRKKIRSLNDRVTNALPHDH